MHFNQLYEACGLIPVLHMCWRQITSSIDLFDPFSNLETRSMSLKRRLD